MKRRNLTEEQKKNIWQICQVDGSGILPNLDSEARNNLYHHLVGMAESISDDDIIFNFANDNGTYRWDPVTDTFILVEL